MTAIAADRLKSFIERIEKLDEERVAIGGDIKDVYSEAKGVGYDVATMRKVVRLRKMDASDRDEQEALLDTYLHALGMVDRIEARAAAGESARQIAAAENVSKSTAHRVSQKARAENDSAKMGQTETAESDTPPGAGKGMADITTAPALVRADAWTCPMRGKVLSCAGREMRTDPPLDRPLIACAALGCPHTIMALGSPPSDDLQIPSFLARARG